jgi:hypothetical protein
MVADSTHIFMFNIMVANKGEYYGKLSKTKGGSVQ